MFKINDTLDIKIEECQGSKIYIINNFFKDPDVLRNYLIKTPAPLWKGDVMPSNNGVMFEDRRHHLSDPSITAIQEMLATLCNDSMFDSNMDMFSNCCHFKHNVFNDYENNYWSPHTDPGYTAIVYLDKDVGPGTNLYEQMEPDVNHAPEHWAPWRPRSKYKIIKTLESTYNRLVLFNGKKFLHGMAIEDDRFFNEERLNVAIFLQNSP
jgi:hypothetical protein